MTASFDSAAFSRRTLLLSGLGAAGALLLAGCAPGAPTLITPTAPPIGAAETARGGTGRVVSTTLRAAATTVDLAGTKAQTWAFGNIPASVIRATAGDTIAARVENGLSTETSVHWHGLALRNDMDGVPGLTQDAIPAGGAFDYRFIAPDPGTYWFHPHVGVQLDRGLYGALIVEDPKEPLQYDDEWVLILDDWLDGITATPDQVLADVSKGMGGMGNMGGMGGMGNMGGAPMRMGNMLMGTASNLLGGDSGDVYYPTYLINGKPPADPAQFTGKPGARIRLRIINAGSDTAFRFAIGDHRLTLTHTDGFPIDQVDVDGVLLGMGERIDALITLKSGAFPIVAAAEGKQAAASAVIRTGGGAGPNPTTAIPELNGQIAMATKLTAAESVRLPDRKTDRSLTMTLTGSMMAYDWAINGRRFNASDPLAGALAVAEGERVELNIVNNTTMWHPIHLHGHTWQLPGGPRKDTSILLPGTSLKVQFDADNPGRWAAHCHNIYHAESGMMTVLGYRA
ncbi:MAG: multicopper oxidase family protein [Microbacterium ginsengisoli]|mgnify:CR=1 FL=1|nr:multicopper oxidase family protein [Microbacterium ginsengisoli]